MYVQGARVFRCRVVNVVADVVAVFVVASYCARTYHRHVVKASPVEVDIARVGVVFKRDTETCVVYHEHRVVLAAAKEGLLNFRDTVGCKASRYVRTDFAKVF